MPQPYLKFPDEKFMVDSLYFLLSLCNVSSKCLLVRLLTIALHCIALHCIALVFTCKILMINKRGRCFNHDPVSPSKTLLERTSLAWKHRSMESNFRYSFWRWLAAASAACCKHGSRTTRRNLLRLPLQSLSMPCFAEAEIWTQKSRDFIHFPLKQRSSARSQIMK